MIKTVLICILCSVLITSTESYYRYFRRGRDAKISIHRKPVRNPPMYWLRNNAETQISAPLTAQQCQNLHFRNLRACRLNKALLSELAQPHLCQSRDGFHPTTVHTTARKKRSIAGTYYKPCSGSKRRVAVLQAKDEQGVMRELVTDPRNYLYQTIISESCPVSNSHRYGLQCRQHSITFQAAVFPVDPTSNHVSVAFVSTPAYCALSF